MKTDQQTQRDYRATFILDTRSLKEDSKAVIEKIQNILSELQAAVKETKNIGYRDFARITDKKHPGDYYVAIDFTASPIVPAALHEQLRLDKTVKRVHVALS